MPKPLACPAVPADALAQQLEMQRDWLAGRSGGFLRGLSGAVVDAIDWTDLDDEWRVRAVSASARVDPGSGRAELVAELHAERLQEPRTFEERSVVLAELPLLREDGTIGDTGTVIAQEMVRIDGPWPRLAGPSTFGVIGNRSGDATVFTKRRGRVIVEVGAGTVLLEEVLRALSEEHANPFTPDANAVARRLRDIELSVAGAARWSRHRGAPQEAGVLSPDAIIEAANAYLSAPRQREPRVMPDDGTPDWRILLHVERLERELGVALLRLRTHWTMRGGKDGLGSAEVLAEIEHGGGSFEDATGRLQQRKRPATPVLDAFATCSGRVTTSLLRGLSEPARGWSTAATFAPGPRAKQVGR